MGFWEFLTGRQALAADSVEGQTFAVTSQDVPPQFFSFGAPSNETVSVAGRITRDLARQVPAVKRARDIICGTLGTIPLQVVDTRNFTTVNALLDQPEVNVACSVTLTRLYEDLFYEGVAWWKVIATNYRGYPVSVERIDPSRITQRDGAFYLDGRKVVNDQLKQFLSPNGGLLTDGARAIRTLLRLEQSAANYANDPMPQGYFRPVDGEDPGSDDEITEFLNGWQSARQSRVTGYVPGSLGYEVVQWSPEQLQMTDARQHAVLEIARLTGIDAEDLSVSTTSRTYFNGQDRRQQRIADVLGPYATAVTGRLRMDDFTPKGFEVRADFSQFLRADDSTRLDNYTKGKALGLYTLEDIADREGLPAPVEQPAPATHTVTQLPNAPKEIEK